MKKLIVRALAITLALSLLCGSAALGESKYVSIKDIRDTIPERWTGEYTIQKEAPKPLKKGDTISIDVPVVAPEVDTVPIVRITWGGPYEDVDASLLVRVKNESGIDVVHDLPENIHPVYPLLVPAPASIGGLSQDEAADAFIGAIKKYMPFMKDNALECYSLLAYGDSAGNGGYRISCYSSFHGIPYIIGNVCFRLEIPSEHKNNVNAVPFNNTYGWIQSNDQFHAAVSAPNELRVEQDDVPLLDFSEIKKALEERVTEGYVYSLDEVRFGYMAFIDPENVGEEFVLRPVWAARGVTTGDLSIPFTFDDPEVNDYAGYNYFSVIVIDAQTGEAYDFNSTRADRRYVPKLITWDDVK